MKNYFDRIKNELLFIIMLFVMCGVGFIGGIFRSCDVSFDHPNDKAICYYYSVKNETINFGGAYAPNIREPVPTK